MINIDPLYLKYGVNRVSRIKTPIIIDLKSLELPYNTTLHLFTLDDTERYATSEDSLLSRNKEIIVRTIDMYSGATMGNYRYMRPEVRNFIKTNIEKDRKIRVLKDTEKKVVLTRNDLLVYNYGGLGSFYKYISNPLVPYYKVINKLTTLIDLVNRDSVLDRNLFVNFDIAIPRYQVLEMLLTKKVNAALLARMSSYTYIIYLELWKYFNPDTREDSVFNKLNIEASKKFYIIFSIGDNGSIVNFFKLASMVKEYPEFNYDIQSIDSKQFRKVLYLFLNKIFTSYVVPESNLGIIEHDDIPVDTSEDVIDEDELDLALDAEDDMDMVDEEDIGISLDTITKADIEEVDIDLSYNTISDIKTEDIKNEDILVNKIVTLKDLGVVSKNKAIKLTNTLADQDKITIELNGTMMKLTDIKNEVDTIIPEEQKNITPTVIATEPGMLKNTINIMDKKVITEQLGPYIVKSMLSVQNTSFVVTDFNVETKENILGGITTYEMQVENLDGGKSRVKILLPKINDDGTFKISGNTYLMRKQKADKPIRKISDHVVSLTSHYGKLFIDKASTKRNEISYWLKNELVKMYTGEIITNLVLNNGKAIDSVSLPRYYTYFNKYVKNFRYNEYTFNFNYKNRDSVTDIDLGILEEHGVVMGLNKTNPLVMTMDNRILEYVNGKFNEIDNIFNILNIDLTKAPVMFASVKLYKNNFPVILLLSYYIGLSSLLKLYKVEHTIYDKKDKVDNDPDYYTVIFSDKKLVIKRDYGVNDLLFGGLLALSKDIKNLHLETFDKRNSFSNVFSTMELSILYINEIKHLEELFVDPMTKTLLLELKEPTTFKGLLIRAIELLTIDDYKHPNDISGVHFRGYNRIAGMVYKELVTAMKDQKNKSNFSKSKLVVNPYSVLAKINEDSTTVIMDDLNPIAALKQTEDITSLGAGGRGKESMSKDTRILHSSEIGIMSEGGKDSGDVGITAYTSANPKIDNTLGLAGTLDFANDGWTSVLSTSAMIAPFGISDDVKRLVFSNIQNSHVIATNNMSMPYVRTGYESVLASRVNDKFAVVAEGNGIVTDITKDYVIVDYKDNGKTYTKKYKLYSWFSKEENGASFKHTLVSNVNKGTKVYRDYVITYDSSFFTPDVYDTSRVAYRQGNTVRVVFVENIESFEDSAAISNRLSKVMSTNIIKSKSTLITKQQTISNMVKIGDKVEHDTPLFIIADKDFDTNGLDAKTLEIIQGIKTSAPKAGVRGTIEDIKIFYNTETTELSDDLKYYIDKSDIRLKMNTGFTGQVDSGYRIKGRPLIAGDIEVKILIQVEDDMGIADKAILGNQLKCTIGDILDNTVDEDGREIDVVFSTKSMSNRIVLSPVKIGLLTTYMKTTIENACDMYFS